MVPVRYSDVAKQWWDRVGKPALLRGAVAGGEDVAIAAWMEAVAEVLKKVGTEERTVSDDENYPVVYGGCGIEGHPQNYAHRCQRPCCAECGNVVPLCPECNRCHACEMNDDGDDCFHQAECTDCAYGPWHFHKTRSNIELRYCGRCGGMQTQEIRNGE